MTAAADVPLPETYLREGSAALRAWRAAHPGTMNWSYRGRLRRTDPEKPAPAVLSAQGGIGASTAAMTPPHEPRRFSIAECKVICGFPADYELKGTYSDQWARLGNAVPPLMMHAIARTLRDGLFSRIGRTRPGFRDAINHDESNMTKPPFKIPSMAEVAEARGTAGLTVASTFSGCGGSCLGFEMAGYRVLWANEFLPIARDSYAANHPETILDGRDIRKVEAGQILDALGMQPGELDVFNGSPPCQAFSTAGQRDKGWGKQREYSNGVSQKNEDLFFEYVRLVKGLQPRVFVAENVAGLTQGVALGYFKEIMRALVACGYAVKCKVLDAQWLGVPQTRTRSIFVGVRKDLGFEPDFPKPFGYRYSLREVLPGLASLGNRGVGGWRKHDPYIMRRSSVEAPAMTITGTGTGDYSVIDRIVHDTGTPSFSAGNISDVPCPAILASRPQTYQVFDRDAQLSAADQQKWRSRKLKRSRQWGDPKIIRVDPNEPMPTVLTSAEMFAHSSEPRKFTMEELRIICGFPADYDLRGTYSEQWARLGNAVPPLMMREISAALRDGLFAKLGRTAAGFREAR